MGTMNFLDRPTSRRALLSGVAVLALAACTAKEPNSKPPPPSSTPEQPSRAETIALDLSDLPPAKYGVWGRLGDVTVEHTPDERLRMCSTVKLPLVGLVLDRAFEGALDLAETLTWAEGDLIGHSPFTRAQTDLAATVAELCEAAARESDNTATNLLIDHVGGLGSLAQYARDLGDETTRFDRYETAMNELDGELDTTTAKAFGNLAIGLHQSLQGSSLEHFLAWMPDGSDGRRIAAAAPSSIPLRHKTGTSGDGAFNDVAILLPESGEPGSLAIFTDTPGSESDEVVVEIARRAFAAFQR
jgi:beta-lactamase class A